MNKPYFLYILKASGLCLFSHKLKGFMIKFEEFLITGFISAISTFSRELNKQFGYSEEYGRLSSIPINENFEIMISYKPPLIGALIVWKKDIDEDMKKFLDETMNEFLLKYREELMKFNGDISIFVSFKDEVERIYRKMGIFSFQIPKLRMKYKERVELKRNEFELIKYINGQNDIKEISQKMGKDITEIKKTISTLLWNETITLSEKVFDNDIYEPKIDLFRFIRTKVFNHEKEEITNSEKRSIEFEVLKAIDGFKTVYEISEEFQNLSISDIKRIISFYFSQGYLEKVELYPQIIKLDDKFLEDYQNQSLALCYSLENTCNGELSLLEISNRIGTPIKEIKKMLGDMGKHVTYKKRYIK